MKKNKEKQIIFNDKKNINNYNQDQIYVINKTHPSLSVIILLYYKTVTYLTYALLLINIL